MAQGDEADSAPKPVDGLDLRTLPIGPEEAFVLSRVDGRALRSEIALSTGLAPVRVNEILERLIDLGAISAPWRQQQAANPPPYDRAELDEAVDLSPARKRQVLDLYYRLESLTHYDLLGVPHSADKQAIKAAYYELVTVVHPDRYFGKTLGSYKHKLEKLFERVTLAHDTLARTKARAEYDAYLKSREATSAVEWTGSLVASEDELAAIERQIREEASRAAAAASAAGAATPAPRSLPGSGVERISKPHTPQPLSEEQRRKSLARKLGGSSDRPRSPHSPSPAPEAAAEDLKRRYDARVAKVTEERLKRYLQQADEAESAKNFIAASNALRIARSLAPDDPALAARFQRAEHAADVALSRQYLEQAQYEERTGSFSAAARHYERAARGNPTANIFERAAHCYLEAQEDLRHASEIARKAVELAPNQVSCRITLARIYAQAGMAQSAMAELERARTIDPGNDTIKDWIKRVRRIS